VTGNNNASLPTGSKKGRGEESAESGGGGINKVVFISLFLGECSLSFVLFCASLFFDIFIVHRFNIACLWMERKDINDLGFKAKQG
jgi:hypothetical protein